jgi:major membrane immunogen (membrane-anchored lipoprotein)
MKKTLWTIFCILLFAAALSACSSKEFPTGTYTSGDYTVEYRDDGTFTLWNEGEVSTEGTYSVTDDEIQFMDSYCAEQDANPGIYKWQHENGRLTCTLIEDPCEGRRNTVLQNWYGPK